MDCKILSPKVRVLPNSCRYMLVSSSSFSWSSPSSPSSSSAIGHPATMSARSGRNRGHFDGHKVCCLVPSKPAVHESAFLKQLVGTFLSKYTGACYTPPVSLMDILGYLGLCHLYITWDRSLTPPPCFLQHKMEQQTLMVFGGAYVSGPLGYMCVSPRL